ncbi:hypothetical protein P152DRAFT_242964 [Eremomyces bilateralis CBS 781.70]|uniref:Uncharacterized protein n=1 Tax=Eremomyces bilateralis CBS 781.70 TaxID=1392243 RepID=A0A6G1GAH8_9PEZI|nr:uncharacterized protein P152DRAFT_242964 [Eremomyces bilateralis CBS 781.70]KAF1815034.1 hypothetical protein P152DRAFT_242964 [Eremomyces bilateralis CBS 781.70]
MCWVCTNSTFGTSAIMIRTPPEAEQIHCQCRKCHRYYEPEPLVVEASDKGRGVTVGEYILKVHPYIQSLKDDILTAEGYNKGVDGGEGKFPENTVLYLDPGSLLPPFMIFEDEGPESTQKSWEEAARVTAKWMAKLEELEAQEPNQGTQVE